MVHNPYIAHKAHFIAYIAHMAHKPYIAHKAYMIKQKLSLCHEFKILFSL